MPAQQAAAKRKTISRTKEEWLAFATKLGKSVRAGNLRLEDADAQLGECPDSRLKLDCMHCVRAELAGNTKSGAKLSFGKPGQQLSGKSGRQRKQAELLTTPSGRFTIAASSIDRFDLNLVEDPVLRSEVARTIAAYKANNKLSFSSRR